MRGLADSGKTVLVSSHILNEVQQVADTVSIIGRGRLLAQGEVDDILEAGAQESARVGIADPARAATVLAEAGFAVSSLPDGMLNVAAGARAGQSATDLDLAQITRLLAEHELYVFELTPVRADLESVFLELTAEDHLGATSRAPQMIRLIGAEIDRLRSRRFTLITLLAVVMILSIFQLQVNSDVSPPSAEAVAANQAQYERDLKEWEQHHEEWERQCVDAGQPREQCAGVAPTKENYGLQAVPFSEIAQIGLLLTIYLTGLAMFLVAASFIGAEFTTGAIANWLSFVPRRVPVFASKLITVATFALLVSVLASAFVLGMAALLTSVHGGEVSGLHARLSMAGREWPSLALWRLSATAWA